MKKVLSIVLCCVLLLLPMATLADPAQTLREKAFVLHPEWRPAEEALAGEWFMVAVDFEGQSFNPEMLGVGVTMLLHADGTALLTNGDTEDACTWVMDGDQLTLTESSGATSLFTVTPDRLSCTEGTYVYVFSRNAEDGPAPFTLTPQVMVEAPESLIGSWGNTIMADPASGVMLPVVLTGYVFELTLTEDSALLNMSGMQSEFSWQVQEGALIGQVGETPVVATLHEGDVLAMDFDGAMQLYFTKLAE